MKLSESQKRAYNKLKKTKYLTAYDLQESLSTLKSLVNKGIAESKSELGCLWYPRTSIGFRKRR